MIEAYTRSETSGTTDVLRRLNCIQASWCLNITATERNAWSEQRIHLLRWTDMPTLEAEVYVALVALKYEAFNWLPICCAPRNATLCSQLHQNFLFHKQRHGLTLLLTFRSSCFQISARGCCPNGCFNPPRQIWIAGIAQTIQWLATGWTAEDYEIDSRYEQIFLIPTSSRPVLEPTQPPLQWVSVSVSLEVNRPGREADHSAPTNVEVKSTWFYTSNPPYIFMT
jgi:hypothetical protein